MFEKDQIDHYTLKLVSCESCKVEMENFITVDFVVRCGFRKAVNPQSWILLIF